MINLKEEDTLRVATFVSRNKDNSNIKGFKTRSKAFLTSESDEVLIEKFKYFVEDGLAGELCRLYVSVNVRDKDKLYKNFLHWLIDNPNYNLSNVSSKIASIAAKPECKLTNKWLFDFDEDPALYNEFVEDIKLCDSEVKLESYKTPNGLCVISSRGFDTRNLDFTSKWKNVELKKDAARCLCWKKKSSSN